MRIRRSLVPSGLLALAIAISYTEPASACSQVACREGSFLPSGGAVPASLPALRWIPQSDPESAPDASGVTMERVTAGGTEAVAIDVEFVDATGEFLIKPQSPLEPDADYIVQGADYCALGGPETPTKATLHTSAAAPLPASLGTLKAEAPKVGPLDVSTGSGACFASITAVKTTVSLEPSEDAAPWMEALSRTTLVDGSPWTRGTLYAQCASADPGTDPGLKEGTHSVVMTATIPGTDLKLETAPISITLECGSGNTLDDDFFPYAPDDTRGCSVTARGSRERGALGLWLAAAGAALFLRRRACKFNKNI